MKEKLFLQHTSHLLIRRWLIVSAGLALQIALLLMLFLTREQTTFATVTLAPVPGKPSVCKIVGTTPLLYLLIWPKYLSTGTLVQAAPTTLDTARLEHCQFSNGHVHVQTVNQHPKIDFDIFATPASFNLIDLVLAGIVGTIFSIAGSTIFLRAQDRPSARTAYCLFYSISFICSLFNLGSNSSHFPWVGTAIFVLIMLTNGLSATFVCLFPRPQQKQVSKTRSSFLPYIPLLTGLVIMTVGFPSTMLIPALRGILLYIVIAYNIMCLLLVIWVIIWGVRSVEKNEQQIVRMIMIGVAFILVTMALTLGIMPSAPGGKNSLLPPDPFTQRSLLHLIPLPLIVLPIIALFRNQILGTTGLLSRHVMRILLWILLASLFIFPAIIIPRFMDRNLIGSSTELRDYLYAVILVVSLWLFPLLWNKVRDVGDHIFYHDFYQYNRSLRELSTAMTSLQGVEQISAFLFPRLTQLLNTPDILLFVRAISQDEMLYHATHAKETTRHWHLYCQKTEQTTLPTEHLIQVADRALVHFKKRSYEPLLLDSILLFALYNGEHLSGLLCLGPKKNLEPYSRQDKSFLATLTAQLSVLEVNSRYLAQAQSDAQKLAALNHRVISAQEDERRLLALDLHDDVLQEAMLLVRDLSDASTMSDVAEAMPLARSVVTNLRRTCLALRPSLLDELGLAAALRWLMRQTEQSGGDKIRLELSCVGETEKRFSTMVELAFYRVVQEALANIIKHSRADHVVIRLHYAHHSAISLIIADNGQGFRMGFQSAESLGIVGMHERMGAIGGHIQLRSSPGHGTIVRAIYTPIQYAKAVKPDDNDAIINNHTIITVLQESKQRELSR